MQKMIILVLGIVVLFLMMALWKKQKQFSAKQLEEQEKQIENRERMEQDMIDCTSKSQDLLKAIHTIHLYASISEEEAQSQQMKENQRTIIEICEEILAKASEL